ncbi:MAG: hypothetical protein ACK47M_07645 [Caldilinea sp.]
MFLKRMGLPGFFTALALALTLGVLSWGDAQASTAAAIEEGALQQTMPMTGTMPGPGATGGDMPMQPGMGQGDMGQMMAHIARMQRMMARMQRMMADGMMRSSAPMTGTMSMAGMMQGDMGEMMGMMAEMQEMMAEMQGMMAGGMRIDSPAQGQPMQSGMMGQMPMMGTMILIAPMPMSGMMHQMPGMMMQGMNMGGMMGQGAPQTAAPAAMPVLAQAGAVQTGKLGAIDVKVTPPDLSNIQGDTIDFTVDLNATGVDLSFDLAKLATLSIAGHAMPATAWEVAYNHGHHVNGVLKFPAHTSDPVESATLTITDPEGGEDLTLIWPPAQ